MVDRFDAIRHDLAYAVRQLRRTPSFTAAVMLTFAIGIGANATMFGVIDELLLRPPAHVRDPEHVVAIAAGTAENGFGQRTLNYPVYKAIRDFATGFEHVAGAAPVAVPMGRGEGAVSISGVLASANYFPTLGVSPAIGRFYRADEDAEPLGAPVVVVSYAFWMRQFGGRTSALGQTLELADRRFTVIGVAPEHFTGPDFAAPDVWIPLASGGPLMPAGRNWATNKAGTWLRVFARVRADVPPERAAADAMRVARETAPASFFTRTSWSFGAIPIMRSRASEQGASAKVITLLGAMSVVVLLIACANVANLLWARGLRRRREVAVRLALGVSRGRLVRLLLTETLLVALLGGAAALLVAYWGGELMRASLFGEIAFDGSPVSGRVLSFTAFVTVCAGAITGLLPALAISRPSLVDALKAGDRAGGGRRAHTRSALLIAQAAMCLVLLAGAGLFVRSLAKLSAMPLGMDVDRVLVASMNVRVTGRPLPDADAVFARALERVQAVPGVSRAALATTVPFGPSISVSVAVPGPDSLAHVDAMYVVVTRDYFRALGAKILRGRDFAAGDAERPTRVAMVNEVFATIYLGAGNPAGRCVRLLADTAPCTEIVGVVANIRRQSIFEDSSAFVFLLAQTGGQFAAQRFVVRSADDDAGRLVEPVRRAIQTAAPQLPYAEVHVVANDPTVRRELRPFRVGASMFGAFGAVALLLAAVGVYGVVSYDVGQRTREIGVRIAVGARARDVAGLVVADGVRVVGIGALIGVGIALAGGRFIAPLLYQLSPRDPALMALVVVVLLVVAVLACLVPAWRAMRVDPVVALQSE